MSGIGIGICWIWDRNGLVLGKSRIRSLRNSNTQLIMSSTRQWARLCRLVATDSSRVIAVCSFELVESLVESSDKEDEIAGLILVLVL